MSTPKGCFKFGADDKVVLAITGREPSTALLCHYLSHDCLLAKWNNTPFKSSSSMIQVSKHEILVV